MLVSRRPAPPLDRYVDCIWYSQRDVISHAMERMLPTASAALVIHLRQEYFRHYRDDSDQHGQRYRGAVVHGAQSGYFVSERSQPDTVIGVHFHPGGAAPFFDMPIAEFSDRHVALDDLWGSEAHLLRERLLAAGSVAARFGLVEQALRKRFVKPSPAHDVVAYALQAFSRFSLPAHVRTVQRATGYSPRHFIQLFRNEVGLSPKLFSRIQRFQQLLQRVASGEQVDWAALAAAAGYYDQSHLIRDFRDFSGITPQRYQPIAPDQPNHVALDAFHDAAHTSRRR